jgi:transcription termination/antitermination protein NusG
MDGEMRSTTELESSGAARAPDGYPGAEAGPWHVLHAKSRMEKMLAADLAAMRVPCFLPLVKQVRYYGKRKAQVELPLFTGYLFVRGPLDAAYEADRTGRVVQIIKVSDQDRLDWELRNLWLALTQDATLDPYPYLKVGVRVEVKSGPFRGLQGVIEARGKNDRLILQVGTLGRAVSLEIHGALLEPVEG